MSFVRNLGIGAKLQLAPLTVLALLLILAITAYEGMKSQRTVLNDIYKVRFSTYQEAVNIRRDATGTYAGIYQLLSWANANFPEARLTALGKKLQADIGKAITGIDGLVKQSYISDEEKKILNSVATQMRDYGKVLGEVVDIATTDYSMATTYMTKADTRYELMNKELEALLDYEQKLSQDAFISAQQSSETVTRTLFIVSALSIVISLAVTFYVKNTIVGPVLSIRHAANELRSGNLTRRVAVETSDEVGQTALAFNELIASFQNSVTEVLVNTEKVSNAVPSLSSTAAAVAKDSIKQNDSAAATSATVQEMTVSIASIAHNAEEVLKTSKFSLENSKKGEDSLHQLKNELKAVSEAVDKITSTVGEFVESTKTITNMTQQVKDIANQTNLLALNAAIEAARAGEQGRGFAVVADEVRQLAEQSAKSASEIDQVTRALSNQSGAVESSIQAGVNALASSQNYLNALDTVLVKASESVKMSYNGIDEITGFVKEQSNSSNEIAKHVEHIAQMAKQNSVSSENASEHAKQLEIYARNLKAAVEKFKV